MKRIRNLAFVAFVVAFLSFHHHVGANGPFDDFVSTYGCQSPTYWQMDGAVSTWCDCPGMMGCGGEEFPDFCDDWAAACQTYCGFYSETSCVPNLVGYVECRCYLT